MRIHDLLKTVRRRVSMRGTEGVADLVREIPVESRADFAEEPKSTVEKPVLPTQPVLEARSALSIKPVLEARPALPTLPVRETLEPVPTRDPHPAASPTESVGTETDAIRVPTSQPGFDLLPEAEWKAAVKGHYDRYLGEYRNAYGDIFQAELGDNPEAFFDWLAEQMQLSDGMQLLDAGCGIAGPALEMVRRYDVQILGVTLGENLAREAREMVRMAGREASIRVVDGDYHEMEAIAGGQQFDRVCFMESIGYSYDLDRLLESVYAVLKPGGRLILRDFFAHPIPADPQKREQQIRGREVIYREWQYLCYERSEWESRLGSAGFRIRSAETFEIFGNPAHKNLEFNRKAGFTYLESLSRLGYAPDTRSLIVAEKPA